jgi:hypothetical protein
MLICKGNYAKQILIINRTTQKHRNSRQSFTSLIEEFLSKKEALDRDLSNPWRRLSFIVL